MSLTKRTEHPGEAVKASMKQAAGLLTGNRQTPAAGHRDRATGHVTRAWVTIKSPFVR